MQKKKKKKKRLVQITYLFVFDVHKVLHYVMMAYVMVTIVKYMIGIQEIALIVQLTIAYIK